MIGDQIEMSRILKGYDNFDRNMFSRLRKIEGLEHTNLHEQRSSVHQILESSHFHREQLTNGKYYQLIVLVVLIYLKIKPKYTLEGRDTLR